MTEATGRADDAGQGLSVRDAGALQRHYASLPTGRIRWRCPEGQAFLHLVDAARAEHGTAAVADALDVSVQGVHYMLGQRQPGWNARGDVPGVHVVRDIQRAHARVVALRLTGKQARKGTREYRDMHLALVRTMAAPWSLEMIATVARLSLRELRRFLDPPSVESLRVLALEDVEAAWTEYLAAEGQTMAVRTGRAFLQLLTATVDLGVSRARVGHRLHMSPERVSLLMSVGMAGLRKSGR